MKLLILLLLKISLNFVNIIIISGELLLESPCPEILTYHKKNPSEPDKWYATVTVGTDEDLDGIWLKIFLDKKAEFLGNWFTESITKDYKEFSIRNPNYKLAAGPPIQIRFFIKYDLREEVPKVKKIYLNGRTICPTKKISNERILHISVGNGQPLNNMEFNHNNNHDYTTLRNKNYFHFHESTTTKKTSSNAELEFRPVYNNYENSEESTKKQHLNSTPLSVFTDDEDEFFLGDLHTLKNKQIKKLNSRPLSASSSINSQIKCGTVVERPRAIPFIINGDETSPGQWPWHVALYVSTGAELKYNCGGTLISEKFIITAAHCVTKPRTNITVANDKVILYLGKYYLTSFGSSVQDRKVVSISVHPEYNATFLFNDIALLKLDNAVEINDYVRPCCLWSSKEDANFENVVGKEGTVVGWGLNEKGELSTTLMKTTLPLISTSECLFSNRAFYSQFLYAKNFCAGYKNDTSICNGDSGGGLVLPKTDLNGQNKIWYLRGVISLGVAQQSENTCDPKQYTIITDVAKYAEWIKERTNSETY